MLIAHLFFVGATLHAQKAPAQEHLKTFDLPCNAKSAEISPDEQSVVTDCIVESAGAHPPGTKKIFAETVKLWDFERSRLIAEFSVPRGNGSDSEDQFFANPQVSGRFVRFTADGTLVEALINGTVHILRATDLAELRTIRLAKPQSLVRERGGRTTVNKPVVRAMEISPDGKLAAVLWLRDTLHGRIQLYDLSSGAEVRDWNTPTGWIGHSKGFVYNASGDLLVVAIPNNTPCFPPNRDPDVFAFDVQTGEVRFKFATGLLTGSVAVGPDNSVLAVDVNCMGVFRDRDPKLKIFDMASGKGTRTLSGRGSGIRNLVSSSADGSRFLAFTGKMKVNFDWGDGTSCSVPVDETFSIWNFSNYEGVVTSQNIPGLRESVVRLSSKGRYAVSFGRASFVYQLP